jgi:type I restriction-modification system DNA methylase subunit
MTNNSINNIIKLIQKLGYRHQTWQVFSDFLELCALSISNSVDWPRKEEREKRYLDTISRYDSKEQAIFPELYGELVLALEGALDDGGPSDMLGQVFHSLELHNKWTGQFFTPSHICEMMGDMTILGCDDLIKERGFVTVSEPCAGSGAMILGFAKAMHKKGYNYCSQMVVTAVDIDLKCVYMTYLQLSLYGIPAVVIQGDTLLAKEYSRWFTPVYVMDGWRWRQECGIVTRSKTETNESLDSTEKTVIEVSKKANVKHIEQLPLIDLGKAS